jgi:hypothetical protein
LKKDDHAFDALRYALMGYVAGFVYDAGSSIRNDDNIRS